MSSVLEQISSSDEFFTKKSVHLRVATATDFFETRAEIDDTPAKTAPKKRIDDTESGFWEGFELRLKSDDSDYSSSPDLQVIDSAVKSAVSETVPVARTAAPSLDFSPNGFSPIAFPVAPQPVAQPAPAVAAKAANKVSQQTGETVEIAKKAPEQPAVDLNDPTIRDLMSVEHERRPQTSKRQRLPRFASATAAVDADAAESAASQGYDFQAPGLDLRKFAKYLIPLAIFCAIWFILCAVFAPPPVTGRWYVAVDGNGQICEGEFGLVQRGDTLIGRGADAIGEFTVSGKYSGNRITLTKSYIAANGALTKPISFIGDVSKKDDITSVNGTWECERKQGYSWRVRHVKYKGKWTAEFQEALPQDIIEELTQNPLIPGEATHEGGTPQSMNGTFLWGAVGVVGSCILLVGGSMILFGPAGKINVWEKRKYIPTQFRAEHRRMIEELAKPVRVGGLPLGQRHEWSSWKFWEAKDLALTPALRRQNPHMLVLGVSGKGKSCYLENMIMHDISNDDRAIVLIDSDGGLADNVMRWIAAHPKGEYHAKRVVCIDPTVGDCTATYNPLAMPDDGDLQSAASAIVNGFKAIYREKSAPNQPNDWNPQTAHILRNAALLLMTNNKNLSDLPALLGDNDFRDFLLQSIAERKEERPEYTTLLETWNQYKKIARTDQWIPWCEPILNRVTPVLGDARIRQVLTSSAHEVSLKRAVKERKIIIVKLPNGQLESHADLVGSLLVTGVKQAALSIANERTGKRFPVALYIDEFDHFIEQETVKALTGESERLSIGLVAAGKSLQDLPEELRNLLLVSFGTIACFALGKKDADFMGPQMFRVDGRRIKHQTIHNFFNRVSASPQFEFVSDEEKLNVDRLIGRDSGTFFCYRVGSVAGVFHMKSHQVPYVSNSQINPRLLQVMRRNSAPMETASGAAAPVV